MKTETQPRLRFPEFQNAGEWEECPIEEITATVTPPKKLQTSEYQAEGEFPIVDQSQDYICGWTNDGEAVIALGLPVIVFGDHTCTLKFIDRPFVQGADGIKILRPKRGIDIRFLFCALEANPVVQESYKRHFSMLKEKKMSFPDPKTGEQQKIAKCLSSVDELMAAQARKVDALKTHKKGLMQQLFPREGETQPRLRFPEFQNAGEWSDATMGTLLMSSPDYGVNAAAAPFSEHLPKYLRITDISEDGRYLPEKQVSVDLNPSDGNYLDEGDIVLARTGASVGKSYQYRKEDGRLVFAGFLIRVKPHPKKLVSTYLANFMTTGQFWKWVTVNSARSGQPGINSTEYSSLRIPLPPTLPEQQRIAACLSSLDALISAETQKHEALKTHKKGLMQQLFPSPEKVEA